MSVAFNSIPANLLTPGSFTEYDGSQALQGTPPYPKRAYVIGSRLSGGTIAANVPVAITNDSQPTTFFGRGSQLEHMLKAFRLNNKLAEVYAIALDDDGGGVAATQTITVTGTATEDSTIHLLIAGQKVDVAVSSGDDATAVATAIAAFDDSDLPVVLTSALGVVTATARHAAAFGNDIPIVLNYDRASQSTPAGLTIAIAAGVTGTTNPDVSTALAAIGDDWATHIIIGYSDAANVALLESELDTRRGPTVQMDGQGFVAVAGSHASLVSYGGARNSESSTVLGMGLAPMTPWEWVSLVIAVEMTMDHPSRPRQNMRVPYALPPLQEDRFTRSERNTLLNSGISTCKVDRSGRVYIERLVTTYQTNGSGANDPTYRNLETMWQLAYLRYSWNVHITSRYPNHSLGSDGTDYGEGQKVVTPSVIRAEALAKFKEWERDAIVEDFEGFKAALVIDRNTGDLDRLDSIMPPNLINQFRVMATQIQFRG